MSENFPSSNASPPAGAAASPPAEANARRFRSLIENALDTITIVDAAGIIVYQSPALTPMLGYDSEALDGQSCFDYVHPDDAPGVAETFGRLLAYPGMTLRVEYRFRHHDGSWRTLESRGRNLLHDPDVAGVVINSRDITEFRQTQSALQATAEQLRLITDAAPVLISYVDDQERYRFNNDGYAKWLKQSPEQINGRHIADVIGEAAYQQIRPYIQAALAGHDIVYEREMPYEGVESRYVHTVLTPDRDAQGNVKGLIAVVSDITESKRQEEIIRESERRYRFLAESIPQIVWTANPDGGIDYYNQRWMEYTGLTLEQTKEWGWRECAHPDDMPHLMNLWAEALRTGGEYNAENRIRGRNGNYRWFLNRAVPLRDASGDIVKWFATTTDIDAQKRVQERERLLNELGEQMRTTNDPETVLWMAVSAVGEHLQTSRCYYADTDAEAGRTVIHRDYCRGVESWAGTYSLSAFGTEVIQTLNQGQTVAIADTLTDPRTVAQYEAIYGPHHIQAYLAVPLMENGKRIASLVVNASDAPRVWTPEETSLLETVAERTRLAVQNARLWQAERERTDQLARAIQEVHHRVKNSLQSVSALLEMQLPPEGDMMPVEAVRDGLSQIKTIALVHDLLARDKPIGSVNAAQVLSNLAKLLSTSMSGGRQQVAIVVDAAPLDMTTKTATSLALAVNELLTNAAKHQNKHEEDLLGNAAAGLITVTMRQEPTREETSGKTPVAVIVQDGGPGFRPDFDPDLHANIGLQLVQTLVRHDLHGLVHFGNATKTDNPAVITGGRVVITFPLATCSEG